MRRARTSLMLALGIAGFILAGTAVAGPAGARTAALYPDTYSLMVKNDSRSPTDIALYQSDPGLSASAVPLVWQEAPLNAGAQTDLSWSSDYSFSLSNSADLQAGAVYHAVQTLSVDPGMRRDDSAELTDSQGVLGLHRTSTPKRSADTLSLEEAKTITAGDASVALDVGGRPASAWKAEPNQTLRFTPHPEYWITAGTYTEGEVINPLTVVHPLRLHLGTKPVITVTLHQGGRWTVS